MGLARLGQLVQVEGRELELTNLDKLLWPEEGITKADFIHYIFSAAHLILPHVKDRPLTVTRFPDGIDGHGFYQKDCPDHAPDWIPTYPVPSKDEPGKVTRYILANEPATLVWLANQAAIELHPWMSRWDAPDSPDYSVIDLDPGAGVGFEDVRSVARIVKEVLDHLGLSGYPKLSGATGIHIYVPLEPKYSYSVTSGLAKYVGSFVVEAAPRIATQERLVKNRGAKVYVDHLQNLPGKTIVAAWCPRPRPGARISVPFEWDELDAIDPAAFTLNAIDRVLARPLRFQSIYQDRQEIDTLLPAIEGLG